MKAAPDIQHEPGVFVLVHEPTRSAYVGVCKDLRHRQTIWERNFRLLKLNNEFVFPIKHLPARPGEEYTYYAFSSKNGFTAEGVRDMLTTGGHVVVNKQERLRRIVSYKGKDATLAEHCRDAGVDYNKAYAAVKRGKTIEEVLGS